MSEGAPWTFLPLYKGMTKKSSIRELIDAWPTRKALADEIGANVEAVHKWAASNRIPSDWQSAVIDAASRLGLDGINGDWMVHQHARAA